MFRLTILTLSMAAVALGGYAAAGGYGAGDGGHHYAAQVVHTGGHDGGYASYGGGHQQFYDHQPIGYDGVPLDTPEVEHAKAEHFRAHQEAKNRLHTGLTYKDLPIDTHEVAIAKVAHAQAHAVVKARNQNVALQHAYYAAQHQQYQGGDGDGGYYHHH